MEFTLTFLTIFIAGFILALPLIVFLTLIIAVMGQVVGRLENWKVFDTLYWSFITATTVGYGDYRPLKKVSRTISVFIAIVGIMLTGVIVAITLESASVAFDKHIDPAIFEKIANEIN